MKPMKGKWARGIEPRMFCWVIKDRMAACERPGGYARNHRKVRRLEELIWLREHGFTMIVSLLDSPHNLHAYDELSLPHVQVPLGVAGGDLPALLPDVYGAIADLGHTLGPALAGAALLVTGPRELLLANAITFAVSAVLIARVDLGAPAAGEGAKAGAERT